MILITGAAGFIGSNVVASLNARGRNDLVLSDWLGSNECWLNLRKRSFRNFVFPEDLLGELNRLRPEAILHLGANSSTTATDGDAVMRTNFQYTLKLLDWCTEARIPFIYASSAATYGDGSCGFDDTFSFDALKRLRPLNLYGWSKHQIDLIVAERVEAGLPLPPKCIGLKYFNVYGPNEYHKGSMISVVGKNFDHVMSGETIDLFQSHHQDYVDGGQKRDFVYVEDIVDVTLWCMDTGPAHGIFNVGTGASQSFDELIGALFLACEMPKKIRYVPMPDNLRKKYQYFTEASMTNLRAAGYEGSFSDVNDGVARYVTFLKSEDRFR